ncbi:hypothetical protein [Flavobacterium sp. 2]|uniref:hypothetical protein n=1 Tax=Flavobacterium sp. 2 TaxID=308053 RepID=UPI003CF7D56D
MKKEKVLVRDNKGIFLKMFKRKFKNEFDFSEESFLFNNEKDLIKYDRSIFVVYEKNELLEFLKMDKKGRNVLVCLFNKQLYSSLSFLDEINNLIVLDNEKTRPEIISELKQHLTENSKSKDKNKEENFFNSSIFQTQFNNFYKGLFFLM